MDDTISRLAVIQIIEKMRARIGHNLERSVGRAMIEILDEVGEDVEKLPSALGTNLAEVGTDCISRAAAQTELQLSARRYTVAHEAHGEGRVVWSEDLISVSDAMDVLRKIPSAQPTFDARDTQYNLPIGTDVPDTNVGDTISRQQAIDDIWTVSPLARLDRKWVDRWLRQLPSAESEPIRINLNEPIKVKLTDWGKEIYYHQYDRINQIVGREICKPKFPKEDENGYTEFQLWCFMELYGEHMGMTLPNVIEPLEIVYER